MPDKKGSGGHQGGQLCGLFVQESCGAKIHNFCRDNSSTRVMVFLWSRGLPVVWSTRHLLHSSFLRMRAPSPRVIPPPRPPAPRPWSGPVAATPDQEITTPRRRGWKRLEHNKKRVQKLLIFLLLMVKSSTPRMIRVVSRMTSHSDSRSDSSTLISFCRNTNDRQLFTRPLPTFFF